MKLKRAHAGAKLVVLFALFLIISACSGKSKTKQLVRVVPVKTGDVMQQSIPVQIRSWNNDARATRTMKEEKDRI